MRGALTPETILEDVTDQIANGVSASLKCALPTTPNSALTPRGARNQRRGAVCFQSVFGRKVKRQREIHSKA
jgi:hypothetical protein